MAKATQGRPRSSTPGPVSHEPILGGHSPINQASAIIAKPASAASTASAGIASSTNRSGLKIKHASKQIRMGFIRKVYSLLTAQLLLSTLIAAPLQTMPEKWLAENKWLFWASFAATVVVLLAMCVEKYTKAYPTNYIILLLFTVFEAVLVGFCSAQYTAGSVCICFATTVLVFIGLTAYAWRTASDFTGMQPYLFGALSSLLWLGFVIGSLGCLGVHIPVIDTIYGALGMMTFVFYIIFDTQCIIGEYKGHWYEFNVDDYVFAAMNLYLDVLNLFLKLLKILGEKKGKKK